MTFGGGGHTKAILSMVPEVQVLALDRDPTAISLAEKLAKETSGRVTPLLGRFSELEVLLSDLKVKPGSVDAVLLDAGCSSMQMDQAERGFSLSKDGPLDMRMDGDRYPEMPSAADVVDTLDRQALASILTAYGEERHARKIASAIVEARRISPITRTQQLANVVAGSSTLCRFISCSVLQAEEGLHNMSDVGKMYLSEKTAQNVDLSHNSSLFSLLHTFL
ncbi:putative methyltransferase-like protein 15 [Takifugu flavidus]|uniref:Putative methyltransferase-like protein 15 n=1 Tax=Takifugu flavidus TaxID=433684 RepID=A0A5C6NLL3_9TELE|nr:putative methyltransferase-like protein 15 [Takifugu flavidus]